VTPEDVSLRARFERFPATVKGAFVVRGEDADPHQVALRAARVVRHPSTTVRDIPLDPSTLDIAPHKDVFVPFEIGIADLESGWYGFEVDLDVDGSFRTVPGGRRFPVSWPRSAVRSGIIRIDKPASLRRGVTAKVERLQSGPDGVSLRFAVEPPEPVTVKLLADDAVLDVVEQEFDVDSGRGEIRAYPILKTHGTLRVRFSASGKRDQHHGQISVKL
jgi:hypothetical protein